MFRKVYLVQSVKGQASAGRGTPGAVILEDAKMDRSSLQLDLCSWGFEAFSWPQQWEVLRTIFTYFWNLSRLVSGKGLDDLIQRVPWKYIWMKALCCRVRGPFSSPASPHI